MAAISWQVLFLQVLVSWSCWTSHGDEQGCFLRGTGLHTSNQGLLSTGASNQGRP